MLLSQTPYHANSFEKNKINNLLLSLIVDTNMPLSIVDRPAFKNYSNGLNARYKTPCRQTIRNTILPQKVFF